jgi:NAD(P)-dependent dehydrogenase (short-subunit alcohol dehydrogenase family)
VPFGVTDTDAVRAGVSNARNQLGPITILVNNAGTIAGPQPGFTGGQPGPFESSGRQGQGREVGAAAVWLASDAGAWITGQTIHLNGGTFQGR